MSGMFLDDEIEAFADQKAKAAAEDAKKRKEGFVKIRALDPRTNTMKMVWVKKDEATIAFEKEEKAKASLEKRQNDVERKKRMLDMLNTEKELKKQEKELAKAEKELMKEQEKDDA